MSLKEDPFMPQDDTDVAAAGAPETDDPQPNNVPAEKKQGKRKRDAAALRKAPQAPKRFKSSYICFFMAKQSVIKEELGDQATVSNISKRSAEMWKTLPPDERAHWEDVAAKDKQRYMVEKATYTGPWQVPWKRAKKDPSAPKRPMSAFLYFSQGRRTKIKEENPDIKNTEVSRILGEMWRSATEEERRPFVEKEKSEREKYKVAMAKWREEAEKKKELEKKTQNQESMMLMNGENPQMQQGGVLPMYGDPYAGMPAQPPYPYFGYQGPYPMMPTAGPYPFHGNGKGPVVLGPNGTPHHYPGGNNSGSAYPGGSPAAAPMPAAADQPVSVHHQPHDHGPSPAHYGAPMPLQAFDGMEAFAYPPPHDMGEPHPGD